MRRGVDVFGDGSGEGDDVVTNFGLDLVDAVDCEGSAIADGVGGRLRDEAEFGESLGGGDFNGEPAAVFVGVGPDAAHLRASVTSDHRTFSVLSCECSVAMARRSVISNYCSIVISSIRRRVLPSVRRGIP